MSRTVMFYKPTRPQAPGYAKHPELVNKVECSICRGLFLPDTKAEKAVHRAWHSIHGDKRMTCNNAKDYGLTFEVPGYGMGAVSGHNLTEPSLVRCPTCGEDVHNCGSCAEEHQLECPRWVEVARLVDEGFDLEADILANTILEDRG